MSLDQDFHIQDLLSASINYLLSVSDTEVFINDHEYISAIEAVFVLRAQLVDLQQSLVERSQNTLVSPSIHRNLLHNLQTTSFQLLSKLRKRLNATVSSQQTLPRIVRLSQKLGLSDKEELCLHYIILHHVGTEFPPPSMHYESRGMLRNMSLFAGINSKNVLEFISPSRTHIKESLIEVVEDPLSYQFSEQTLKMSKPVLSALVGCQISEDEFLTIEGSTLADVLLEEGITFRPEQEENIVDSISPIVDSTTELYQALSEIQTLESKSHVDISPGELTEDSEDGHLSGYSDDLEYLNDRFQVIAIRMELYSASMENEKTKSFRFGDQKSTDLTIREFQAKEKHALRKCIKRLEITKNFTPRLEMLGKIRNLSDFEKWVLLSLIGGIIAPQIRKTATSYGASPGESVTFTVGKLLNIHFQKLKDQIHHRHVFYKSGTLIAENMVKIPDKSFNSSDLMDWTVEIDRRMLDFCVALDTEIDSLVEGSQCFTPTTHIDQVIVPKDLKELILSTILNTERFSKLRSELGFDGVVSYGKGLVILFHGMSGTGKTMMAHALANHLDRKLITATFPDASTQSLDLIRVLLREAKLQKSVIFFDECEVLFESRSSSGRYSVNALLSEIEKYDDLILLATNRPFDLDEAMHRRISLAVEFPNPDPMLREQIWRSHIPPSVTLDEDVDLKALSMEFELTGGFIKNSVLSALANSMHRFSEDHNIVVSHDDLLKACRNQIKGQAQLVAFDRRIIPSIALDSLVLSSHVLASVKDIVAMQRAQKFLMGNWGFDHESGYSNGLFSLFYGAPGVGKSSTAEALAQEIGKPMKILTCSEILSMYKYPSAKRTSPFADFKNAEALLVIEGAEMFLNPKYEGELIDSAISLLLFNIQEFKGIVIFIATLVDGSLQMGGSVGYQQEKFLEKMNFVVNFDVPDKSDREKIWRLAIPSKTPVSKDVDFAKLASEFSFVGETIKKAIFRAACHASFRENKELCMKDLFDAAQQELEAMNGNDYKSKHSFAMYQ